MKFKGTAALLGVSSCFLQPSCAGLEEGSWIWPGKGSIGRAGGRKLSWLERGDEGWRPQALAVKKSMRWGVVGTGEAQVRWRGGSWWA